MAGEPRAPRSCAHMQRVLASARRLARPWRPLPARSCASAGAARDPEIQVRALEGPDRGERALPESTQEAAGASRGRAQEGGAWRCRPAQATAGASTGHGETETVGSSNVCQDVYPNPCILVEVAPK